MFLILSLYAFYYAVIITLSVYAFYYAVILHCLYMHSIMLLLYSLSFCRRFDSTRPALHPQLLFNATFFCNTSGSCNARVLKCTGQCTNSASLVFAVHGYSARARDRTTCLCCTLIAVCLCNNCIRGNCCSLSLAI